jgi:hypothetical protein
VVHALIGAGAARVGTSAAVLLVAELSARSGG